MSGGRGAAVDVSVGTCEFVTRLWVVVVWQAGQVAVLLLSGAVTTKPFPFYANGSVTLTLWEDEYPTLRNSTAYTFCHCVGACGVCALGVRVVQRWAYLVSPPPR